MSAYTRARTRQDCGNCLAQARRTLSHGIVGFLKQLDCLSEALGRNQTESEGAEDTQGASLCAHQSGLRHKVEHKHAHTHTQACMCIGSGAQTRSS